MDKQKQNIALMELESLLGRLGSARLQFDLFKEKVTPEDLTVWIEKVKTSIKDVQNYNKEQP